MNQQFWNSIDRDISNGRLKRVIEKLRDLQNIPEDTKQEILLLSARFSSLDKQKNLGVIASSKYQLGMNQITHSTMSLISSIKDDLAYQQSNGGSNGGGNSDVTKILFLSANPDTTGKLKLDQEYRDIDEGLRRAKHRDRFELVSRWAVRPIDLRRSVIEEAPKILHFAGHGETYRDKVDAKNEDGENTRMLKFVDDKKEAEAFSGGIVLLGDNNNHKIVDASALGALIGLVSMKVGKIDCVILNACYSAVQAKEIVKHARYVIGMDNSISDKAAIIFAVAFYDALGAGEDIPFAFELAKVAIQLEGLKENNIPILHKGED
jgi:hypothetical protein